MKTMQQMLDKQRRTPITVEQDDSVLSALQLMAKHDIGAVMVMHNAKLVGIFSERDYARKIILHGKNSKDTAVKEIMTDKVLYIRPEQTSSEAMALMTDKHIRHLPVLDANQNVLGIISIGDLVKEIISHQAFLIQQLEQYIQS